MLREALDYARDLTGYLRVISTRRALKRRGGGTDFAGDSYKRAAREAFADLHPQQMRLRIVEVIEETATTSTLRCERLDGALPLFRAGQHVNVFAEVDGVHTSRPYSISSAPGAEHLDLTIKVGPRGFVAPQLARRLGPGAELVTSGPSGSFRLEPLIHGRELVFIAAGSGITPFMSMIRDLAKAGEDRRPRVHLLYGSRAGDVIFREELEALARNADWLTFTLVLSGSAEGGARPTGRIERELIASQVGDPAGKTFFICGPEGFYHTAETALRDLGVERHRVLRERFGAPADVTLEPSWPASVKGEDTFEVEIEHRGTITVRARESLLSSLERHHLSIPVVCRSGQCSSCRVRVVDGPTFTLPDSGLRRTDRDNGFVHACETYAVGDLRLRV